LKHVCLESHKIQREVLLIYQTNSFSVIVVYIYETVVELQYACFVLD